MSEPAENPQRVADVSARVAVLEAKTELYDRLLTQNSQTLCHVRSSLEMLTRLEERHDHLDRRLEDVFTRARDEKLERREADEKLDNRVTSLEPAVGMGLHFRGLIESIAVPLIASLVSGIMVAGTVYWIFSS